MRTKRKLSLTVDNEVFDAIEDASRTYSMAKSHIVQRAVELWLRKETEALMVKGYEEMAEEDRALAEITFESQRETVS